MNHPQTCGKSERAHQRVLKWLRRQPLAHNSVELQTQLDTYRAAYNHRPNQVLKRLTPRQRYDLGPVSGPDAEHTPASALHVTRPPVSTTGSIAVDDTMIGLGRRYAATTAVVFRRLDLVSVFIGDQLVRSLTIDRTRRYQRQDH